MITPTIFTLDNGLKVIHHQDSATVMVALDIMYNVGSRDERPEHTGMAHLFEHLMFGGSANIPHFDRELEEAGGTNNAWTNADFTNFYDIVPAHNVETAFWLESDRMNALAFSEKALEVQRQVVCEEFKQVCLNQPYGDLHHHLLPLAYTVHPYRTPVIGAELSHIQGVTQDLVRDFFYSHYAPNNAVMAVVGNISLDDTRRMADKWFGPIPMRHIKPRLHPDEPDQTAPRRKEVSGRVPDTMIVKAYHMPAYSHPDYPVADIITDLLGTGLSSRFYRRIMLESDLFSQADASVTGNFEPGLLLVNGIIREGAPADQAEQMLEATTLSLITDPPSRQELQRALNRYESTLTFSNIGISNQASTLAQCAMHGESFSNLFERYRGITVDDVVRVASEILRPENSSTVIYSPQHQG